MERLILSQLKDWKNKKKRKPLLITGVRQCGKTYLIKEFGENEFADMAYFNFDGNAGLASVFDFDFDTERIIDELGSIVAEKKIIPGRTLVVFDEIQDCPRAIQSLKYFCENMPDLHIIAAGSLLGVALREEGISFPVGKVDRLEMYPMSFEEFVMADDGKKYIDGIKKLPLDREIPALYTARLKSICRIITLSAGCPKSFRLGWTLMIIKRSKTYRTVS